MPARLIRPACTRTLLSRRNEVDVCARHDVAIISRFLPFTFLFFFSLSTVNINFASRFTRASRFRRDAISTRVYARKAAPVFPAR